MTSVSVIIPTHNRIELLREAIGSVKSQSYKPYEIIVVDDGSQPPVDPAVLREEFEGNVVVLRNDEPHGLSWVRNQGVEAATGDIITHLDDDDLFSPDTIKECIALLDSDNELDLVFLGVSGFGKKSGHFNRVQGEGVKRVIEEGRGFEYNNGLVEFNIDNSELFGALLNSVPSAFQHVMVRRKVWHDVSALRLKSYCLDPDMPDEKAAMQGIAGPFRDGEWALYAAVHCRKMVLLNEPRYLARCEGQGRDSRPSQKENLLLTSMNIKTHLLQASLILPEFKTWHTLIRLSLAHTYFTAAYHSFYGGDRIKAWKQLRKALKVRAHLSYIKFAFRTLLPRGILGREV